MKTAHDVLERYWDGYLPVDPERIAKAMGITVKPDFFIEHSGHYRYEGGNPVITYNVKEAPVRRRFTVAHEIGHHVHGDIDAPRDTAEEFSSSSWNPREVAANRFAAALLMPEAHIKHVVYKQGVTDVVELADIFGVSSVAMHYRLKNIGMI